MSTQEKLELIESFYRAEDDNIAIVYARMYGLLAAYVREEDLDQILSFRNAKESN